MDFDVTQINGTIAALYVCHYLKLLSRGAAITHSCDLSEFLARQWHRNLPFKRTPNRFAIAHNLIALDHCPNPNENHTTRAHHRRVIDLVKNFLDAPVMHQQIADAPCLYHLFIIPNRQNFRRSDLI